MYVQSATGPALTGADAVTMLNTAAIVLEHYLPGTLYELSVSEQNQLPPVITAYPNPAGDMLYIFNAPQGPATLYDALGRRVAEAIFDRNKAEFDVRNLPAGAYLARTGNQSLKVEVVH